MNSKNLIIRVQDFNVTVKNPELMAQLYKLTIYKNRIVSGMTYELDNLTELSQERYVHAKVLLANRNDELVGWALLTREKSDFMNRFDPMCSDWYNPNEHGTLFEVFIKEEHRRTGVATELLKVARRKASPYALCFVPHDPASYSFYDKFKHYNHRII